MAKRVYENKMAYEVEITHIVGLKPETERCLMITDCEPTKGSIREGHLVKFAYFPDDIMRSSFVSDEFLKFQYVKNVKIKRALTPEEALETFGNAKKWLDAFVSNEEDNLSRAKTNQVNLSKILSEIKETNNL
jgi:hypothetical protein